MFSLFSRHFPLLAPNIGRFAVSAMVALWLGLASQLTWILVDDSGEGHGWYALTAIAGFALVGFGRGRNELVSLLMRLFVGIAFLGSVADRFGLFGGPGSEGVSWGSFPEFVTYTENVNAFLPAALAPALAVIATAFELVIGVAIMFGRWQRPASAAAACLLATFGLAMTISLGAFSTFQYSVWLLAGGSFMLSQSVASSRQAGPLARWWSPRRGRAAVGRVVSRLRVKPVHQNQP